MNLTLQTGNVTYEYVLICQADIQEHAINKYRSVEGHVELLINECKQSFYMFAFAIMKSNE